LDIAQALQEGQLGKGPAAKLVCTREALASMIASIPVHDAVKRLPRRMVHDLGEGQFANVHEHLQTGECRKGGHMPWSFKSETV